MQYMVLITGRECGTWLTRLSVDSPACQHDSSSSSSSSSSSFYIRVIDAARCHGGSSGPADREDQRV